MSCDLAPRDPIVPVPFDFPLRTYSRWLYPFLNRYNYGSQTPYGDWSQISKAVLQRAIATGRFRYIPKLSERHLTAHLQETMTYYYTGSRRRNILLLCLDVDAHEGQPCVFGRAVKTENPRGGIVAASWIKRWIGHAGLAGAVVKAGSRMHRSSRGAALS